MFLLKRFSNKYGDQEILKISAKQSAYKQKTFLTKSIEMNRIIWEQFLH